MGKRLDITEKSRKKTAFILLAVYAMFSLIFLIRFGGYFAHDEIYHISAADADFFSATNYKRAPYLNLMIRGLTSVFGRNYYVYKLIPYVLGLISFSVFLYMIYHLAEHTYSIVCFALLMCTHSLLILNHMYIRMYVCDEAVIAVLALILYRLAHVSLRGPRIVLYFLYFAVASVLWLFQPTEKSSIAVLATGIAALVLNYVGIRIISYLRERNRLIPALIVCGIVLIAAMAGIVSIRLGLIPRPDFFTKIVVNRHASGISQPVFIGYFLTKGIFLSIGLIGFGRLLLTKELRDNLLGIYLLGLIPFLAYTVIYFDQRLFRAFTSFLPVLIFVTVLWLDHFSVSRRAVGRIIGVTVLTALFSYPRITMHIKEFYTLPYSVGEVAFDDYGGLVAQASEEISNGRKCFCIWVNTHAEAAFRDLQWDEDICLEDDLNNRYEYTEQDFQELLDYFETLQEPYVLVIGADSARKIDYWITTEFMNTLRAEYSYVEYPQDAYLFYIN
ncbi:MAG: hypothetical protein K2O65_08670 [Lachnospiraceae bacterium]|nr:hypothetical protein [Lachnospiraceae bacterium]